MDLLLPVYGGMGNSYLQLGEFFVGSILSLDGVQLGLHVAVELRFLLFDELALHLDYLLLLYDLFGLLLDPVGVALRESEVQLRHVVHGLSVFVQEFDLILQMSDDGQQSLDYGVGEHLVLLRDHLHEVAAVEVEGLL